MASYTIVIAVGFIFLFNRLHVLPSALALPLPAGSGSEPQTVIDCTAPTASTGVELGELRTGLRALGGYAEKKHKDEREEMYSLCPLAVLFVEEYYKTRQNDYNSAQTASGQPLADWYAVLAAFDTYIESLEDLPINPSATSMLNDNSTLQTLTHIIAAVKEELLDVLQTLGCNCTGSACSVVNKDLSAYPNLHSCQDPVTSILKFIKIVTIFARKAVQLMGNHNCCTIPQVSTAQWIENHIPLSSPDYSALQNLS